MIRNRIIFLFLFLISMKVPGQDYWPVLNSEIELNPSDITRPYNNLALAGEYFNMVQGNIWKWNVQGGVAFAKNKHGISFEVPFVRSVYPGVEQLTGIGDISVKYQFMTYDSKMRVRTLASSGLYVNLSIPTGNSFEGHGAGVPIISPGFALAYRPVRSIAIYPHIRYSHSFGEIADNWYGNSGSIPDNSGSDAGKARVLSVESIFNYEFNQAWIGLSPEYNYSFSSKEGTLNLRPQIGKLFAEKISINLSSSFYIAGRRRLISWTYFDVRYFF